MSEIAVRGPSGCQRGSCSGVVHGDGEPSNGYLGVVWRKRVLRRGSATCISAVSPLRSTVVLELETWSLPAHLL